MDCECSAAGFCNRYQKVQGERAIQICKGEVLTPEKCEVYRQNWDKLRDGTIEKKPGIVTKAAKATAKWIAAGSPLRTTEELGECFDICRDCEEYRPHPIATCGKCGCFLSAKARMATESCPLGKWPTDAES